jgi:hypothetical protein
MLKRYVYEPVGNDKLLMEEGTSFPVLTAVNGYAEPGESFRVIAVCPDSEDGRRNLGLLRAVQYAYRVKRNTSISCILYGQVDRSAGSDPNGWKARVYDETALLQLDEIVRILAERKVPDPKAVIDSILGL